jgi:hypothetical protein
MQGTPFVSFGRARWTAHRGKPWACHVWQHEGTVHADFQRVSRPATAADAPLGRLARVVRPLAARRSCCSAAAVYGVAGATIRDGMAAATVRYATFHTLAGRDVACCSHHAPCATCHSARARDMPDARIQEARLRGCGGPACALPGSDDGGSCMARAADATCGAQHTMRRSSRATLCTVRHAAYSGRLATQCTVQPTQGEAQGGSVVHLCHTPSQPELTGTRSYAGVRGCSHACARDLNMSVCMCMPALGQDKRATRRRDRLRLLRQIKMGSLGAQFEFSGSALVRRRQHRSEALCPLSSHQTRFAHGFGRRVVEADHGHEESAVAIHYHPPQMLHTL